MKNLQKMKRALALLLAFVLFVSGLGNFSVNAAAATDAAVSAPTDTTTPEYDSTETPDTPPAEDTTPPESPEASEEPTETKPDKPDSPDKPSADETLTPDEPENPETDIIVEEPMAAAVAEGSAEPTTPVDRTNDAEEVGLEFSNLTVRSKDNRELTLTGPVFIDNSNQYDLGSNAFYDVSKIVFTLTLRVKKTPQHRKLKSGDTLKLPIPSGLTLSSELTSGSLKNGTETIADYQAENGYLVFTFAESVNAEKENLQIAGGMNLELTVDHNAFKGKDKVITLLPARGDSEPATTLKLPAEPNTVSGITKEGKLNADNNTISWEISVGTDNLSKGADLSYIELIETIGADQTFVSAAAGDTKLAATSNSDGTYTISLKNADLTAPATITVITAVTASALSDVAKTTLDLTNTVTMQAIPNSPITIEHLTAQAKLTIPIAPGVEKSGVQLNSNTIRWTIKVNHTEPYVSIYKGMVIDTLADGLTYETGSLTYNGQPAATEKNGEPNDSSWEANTLFLDKQTQTMYFCMDETVNSACTISFITTVTHGFTGDTSNTEESVFNEATLSAQFPYCTGTTIDYGQKSYDIPGVSVTFTSAKLNKSVAVDTTAASGQLTWTIEPSTRMSDYETAVITDTIESNQRYCKDSLKIFYKTDDNTDDLQDKGIFTSEYDDDSKTLKLTFTRAKASENNSYSTELSDYKIVYKTDALNYLHKNKTNTTYSNTATLVVESNTKKESSSASASAELSNSWVHKETGFTYDKAGTPYFYYTITLNKNNIQNLTNVVVEDDISEAIRFTDNDSICKDWQFDPDKTKIHFSAENSTATASAISYDTNNQIFSCKFDELSEEVTITLYATYTGDKAALTTGAYANKKMYSLNIAKASCDQIYALDSNNKYLTDQSLTKGWTELDNTLVKKSGGKLRNADSPTLTWQVVINPNSGKMGTITISDSIAKTQKYVTDSVKLYDASFASGELKKGAEKDTDSFETTFELTKDARTMTITTDAENKPLILEYQTTLLDTSLSQVYNDISITEGSQEYGVSTASWYMSGSNWGTFLSGGNLKIEKQDSSMGANMPLAGATFTIYKDAAGTDIVDFGETDGNGIITFWGLEVDTDTKQQTYYYKETSTPAGYIADDAIYPITIEKGKTITLSVKNIRKSTNSSTPSNVTLTKRFIYVSASGEQKTASGKTATFQLYFYPYGKNNTTGKIAVALEKTSDGIYTYNTNTAAAATAITHAADGTISIKNLPWGDYSIEEVSTSESFDLLNSEQYFSIAHDSAMTVTYDFGDNDTANNGTLINQCKLTDEEFPEDAVDPTPPNLGSGSGGSGSTGGADSSSGSSGGGGGGSSSSSGGGGSSTPPSNETDDKPEEEEPEADKETPDKDKSDKDKSDEDNSDKDNSDKDNSDKDKSDKDKSNTDKSDKDKTDKNKSDKDKPDKEKPKKETSNKDTSNKNTSDKNTSDKNTSNKETSEKESSNPKSDKPSTSTSTTINVSDKTNKTADTTDTTSITSAHTTSDTQQTTETSTEPEHTKTTVPAADAFSLLPQTGKEPRAIYWIFGGIFVVLGCSLCMFGKKKK